MYRQVSVRRSLADTLEYGGYSLAAAYAHGHEAEVLVAEFDFLQQLDGHDCAGGSDRMAEADAASVDVGLVEVEV